MTGADELHWRGAAGRSYYALMLECRDALLRWGFVIPRRENVHTFVRLRFSYPADSDLRAIGDDLDICGKLRSRADYDLSTHSTSSFFASAADAQNSINRAALAIDLLDAIEADPVRKADAIAAIRAAFP